MDFLLRKPPINENEAWLDFRNRHLKLCPSLAGGFFTAEPPLLDIGSTNAGVDCGWDEVPLAHTERQRLTLQGGSVGDVSWLVYCFIGLQLLFIYGSLF